MCNHSETNYRIPQFITGHGHYRGYLQYLGLWILQRIQKFRIEKKQLRSAVCGLKASPRSTTVEESVNKAEKLCNLRKVVSGEDCVALSFDLQSF